MKITVELSQDDLEEIELDKIDLKDYLISVIDGDCKGDICFPPYNMYIEVK